MVLIYHLIHHMAGESSKEEVDGDGSEDDPAEDGEDLQYGHQDHQALHHLYANTFHVGSVIMKRLPLCSSNQQVLPLLSSFEQTSCTFL